MTENLKPCPFCGDASDLEIRDRGYPWYSINCVTCGMMTWAYKTKDEAIRRWNTRADMHASLADERDKYKCLYEMRGVEINRLTASNTGLVDALEETLMFADKIAEDYIKLSEMLERKDITTHSPLIVIREMHNHLVEVSEKALKATKEG